MLLTALVEYLFGVTSGTTIVLLSASIAVVIGYLLGRTFLRTYVERILEEKPEFQRIDKAIGQEGLKLFSFCVHLLCFLLCYRIICTVSQV